MNISLADKRPETFVPPAYVAFSSGTSLGGAAVSDDGMFDPAVLPMGPELDEALGATTTIQIKTSAGKKLRLKVRALVTLCVPFDSLYVCVRVCACVCVCVCDSAYH